MHDLSQAEIDYLIQRRDAGEELHLTVVPGFYGTELVDRLLRSLRWHRLGV